MSGTKLSLGSVAEAAGLKRFTTGKCHTCGTFYYWKASSKAPLSAAYCSADGESLQLTQKRTNVAGRKVSGQPTIDMLRSLREELEARADGIAERENRQVGINRGGHTKDMPPFGVSGAEFRQQMAEFRASWDANLETPWTECEWDNWERWFVNEAVRAANLVHRIAKLEAKAAA